MNKNKHLLLWSSLAVLALLVAAAVEENYLKEWRRIQQSMAVEGEPIDVRLRQIVIPELGTTDRCVTCHVGMAPGEMALAAEGTDLAAPHPFVWHDPAEFGCTTCHGGQGLATEMADAHGEVRHWPEPMLPGRFAYASCGSCHTHLGVPDFEQLDFGVRLLERHDCLACHAVDGRGGTTRPFAAAGIEAPDLSHVGLTGFDPYWYVHHLEHHELADEGPWKTSFAPIDPADLTALEAYLGTRVGAPGLVAAKSTFHSRGCYGCHQLGGVGGDEGPELDRAGLMDPELLDFSEVPGERTVANWLATHLHHPAALVDGSQMPAMGLSDEEIELLTFYMLSLRREERTAAFTPNDRLEAERFGAREFTTDGPTLYAAFCSACHGAEGQGRRYPDAIPFPSVANADFLAVASDGFLRESLRRGRLGRRMPAFAADQVGLTDEEIDTVIAYLRHLAGDVPAPPEPAQFRWVEADAALGETLYRQHCASCHGAEGDGPEAPALDHPTFLETADDSYLVDTITRGRSGTPMHGFGSGTPAFPALAAEEIEAIVSHLRTWQEE